MKWAYNSLYIYEKCLNLILDCIFLLKYIRHYQQLLLLNYQMNNY